MVLSNCKQEVSINNADVYYEFEVTGSNSIEAYTKNILTVHKIDSGYPQQFNDGDTVKLEFDLDQKKLYLFINGMSDNEFFMIDIDDETEFKLAIDMDDDKLHVQDGDIVTLELDLKKQRLYLNANQKPYYKHIKTKLAVCLDRRASVTIIDFDTL